MSERTAQSETTCLTQSETTEKRATFPRTCSTSRVSARTSVVGEKARMEYKMASTQRRSPVAAVMAYTHRPLIQRLVEKEGLAEHDAHSLMQDMLRFLYLCGTRKERFGPPEKIDIAWHHFILFTKDYADFCHRFFGRFIHHSPITTEDRLPPGEGSTVKRTFDAAVETFGRLSSNWAYRKGAEC